MKKTFVWVLAILLGAIIIAVLWYITAAPSITPQQTPATAGTTTTLPVSGSTGFTTVTSSTGASSGSVSKPTMTLAAQTGSIAVNDFIHNGVTIPDASNPGNYLLAGNLGYCWTNPQKCQAAAATDFTVYYNSAPQSFTITLTKEPIGQARLDMQQFMLTTLGISETQLCNLNYLVGVTKYVNSGFTGNNLGFSFCPGATPLPQ